MAIASETSKEIFSIWTLEVETVTYTQNNRISSLTIELNINFVFFYSKEYSENQSYTVAIIRNMMWDWYSTF